MVCAIPGEVEEGERRHHIMANQLASIKPANPGLPGKWLLVDMEREAWQHKLCQP